MFRSLILNNLQMKCYCFLLVELVFGTGLFDSRSTQKERKKRVCVFL